MVNYWLLINFNEGYTDKFCGRLTKKKDKVDYMKGYHYCPSELGDQSFEIIQGVKIYQHEINNNRILFV